LFALPAAGQAALVSSSACTVPAATPQFAGDAHAYYDAGGLSVSPGNPQDVKACVNVTHPTVRLSIASGDPGASLSVTALFNVGATTVAIPVGTVSVTPGVSPVMTIHVVNLAALSAGGTVPVTLRISAQGGSANGDVWVDPWGG